METFVILIIVSGFIISQYLYYKHSILLEFLIKTNTPQEAKELIKTFNQKPEEVPDRGPETLQDLFDGNSAEDIKESFRKPE